jgi:hypothetical protein
VQITYLVKDFYTRYIKHFQKLLDKRFRIFTEEVNMDENKHKVECIT